MSEINNISEDISNGIKIGSYFNWHEFDKKSNKYFLNLGKY